MNATTERAALLRGVEIYEEMTATVDDRTLEILDRRRRTAVVKRRGWLVRRMLLLADVVGLLTAFLIAEWVVGVRSGVVDHVDQRAEILIFVLSIPAWVVVTKLYGLYDQDEERTDHSTADDVIGVFHMVTVCAWLFFGFAYLTKVAHPTLGKLLLFWALAVALVSIGRATARSYCRRRINYLQNTIIVGAGDIGQLVGRKLLKHPEYGINLVGFVDSHPKERREDLAHLTVLGAPEKLPALVRMFDIERVIIAFSNETHEDTLNLIRSIKDLDVQVDIVPRLFELVGPGVGIHSVEGLPLVGLPPMRLSHSSRLLKRALDLIVSIASLVLLAPVFALLAVAIKLDSRGPVFFRQVRMGQDNRTFRIFKFRTMTADADERKADVAHLNQHLQNGGDPRMFKIRDDPRSTRVGRLLRRTSLDELPQFVNVFRGQMSLVGPRPLILEEDRYVDAWGRQRVDLKPGLTGPWQVMGRSEIPFEEMVQLDYLYVTGWSLFNDMNLILRTIPIALRASNQPAGRSGSEATPPIA
ncbi:MAG TPA: sugar transferase [Gaiellaceae bacterium]|jgi:exopolysaccharide biosynthesis polyprenyl glycosylphosphotransferase